MLRVTHHELDSFISHNNPSKLMSWLASSVSSSPHLSHALGSFGLWPLHFYTRHYHMAMVFGFHSIEYILISAQLGIATWTSQFQKKSFVLLVSSKLFLGYRLKNVGNPDPLRWFLCLAFWFFISHSSLICIKLSFVPQLNVLFHSSNLYHYNSYITQVIIS